MGKKKAIKGSEGPSSDDVKSSAGDLLSQSRGSFGVWGQDCNGRFASRIAFDLWGSDLSGFRAWGIWGALLVLLVWPLGLKIDIENSLPKLLSTSPLLADRHDSCGRGLNPRNDYEIKLPLKAASRCKKKRNEDGYLQGLYMDIS